MTPKRKLASKPAKDGIIPEPTKARIRAESFQVITFYDEPLKRQILILYSLGTDGVVRELRGTQWHPYPIT